MAIKSDRWIRRMAQEHGMISPFNDRQVREGVISYGVSSYGYDLRVADEFKIFDMIWKRTIASQMADARGRRTTLTIEGEGCVFQVSGKTIDFPGYLRAYVEGSDTPDAELAVETVFESMK